MSKYTRTITQTINGEDRGLRLVVDVYDVLRAFVVTDPAIQHALKKLLCPGVRGAKGMRRDLEEAVQSIERAIDAIKAEEVFGEEIDAEFEIVPPADPPQGECPFRVGDVMQHREHGLRCRVEQINSDKRLIWVRDIKSGQPFYIAKTGWGYYEVANDSAPLPQPECPFKVGDIIAKPNSTGWKIDRIFPDRLHVTSDDPYQTPSQIDRQFWGNYRIVVPTTIDATQQTC
jgi:hypothetical protein